MPYELSDETRRALQRSLEAWVAEHLEVEIGELKSSMLLERVVALIGASAYNHGVADAQAWLQVRLLDMEGDLTMDAR